MSNLKKFLKDIADAIRKKKGTTELINAKNFVSEIENLPSGGENTLKKLLDTTKSATYLFDAYKADDVSDLISFNDTSSVTDVHCMFRNCTSLTTIPLLDTSSVTNMNAMFWNCASLTSIPLLDTSNVTNMNTMFYICKTLTTIPQLDTSKVTSMTEIFYGCTSLTTIPLLDTSKVTDMSSMFSGCTSLTSIPLLDTSKVTNMDTMFRNCTSLITIPQLYVLNVRSMINMFYGCTSLTTIPALQTLFVTSMNNMFYNCSNLETISEISFYSVSSSPNSFVYGCRNLKNLKITNIKVNLQIGSGSVWGHLLTIESLLFCCKHCIKQSSKRTLTIGTVNKEKIANIYVNSECEQVDASVEGAMLVSDYMYLKNWTLA